jgi:protein-S-isoprenylcysteine O-methyltransferase Ste14
MMPRPPSPPQSAGVRVDPQLIYAIPLAGALLLDQWYPMRSIPPRLAAPVGIALLIIGLTVGLAAVRRFRSARTTLQPWEPTTTLVTDGPFRHTRNPIYMMYTLVYLGVGLWVNSVWPLVLLPLVFLLMHRLVITREEAYLESRFGDVYRAYRQQVRRWL